MTIRDAFRFWAFMLGGGLLVGTLVVAYNEPSPPQPPSTVKVEMEDGHGSGVHIGRGLVLTAAHVVAEAKSAKLKSQDGVEVDAIVLWANPEYDTALLYAPTLKTASSPLACRTPIVGEDVHAFGNPHMIEFAYTWGRVSAIMPDQVEDHGNIAINISFIGGMSGGPLFDRNNNVIGLVQATLKGTSMGIAVPMSAICRLLGRT